MQLEYIRQLNDQIIFSLERIAVLRSQAYPGAIVYDDTGASKPMPTNKLERIFSQIDEEERRVNRLIDKRYALKCQAIRAIQRSNLPVEARHVLYLRYLALDPVSRRNLSWSEVVYHVNRYHNIQRRRILQLHHDAVLELNRHNM